MKRPSKIKKGSSSASNNASRNQPSSFVMRNILTIAKFVGAVVVLVLAMSIWRATRSVIQNLVNSDVEVLKDAIFGDLPYLFYCARGGKSEVIPPQFNEVNSLKGSSIGMAMVNCSQVLPSGKNLWERFKLKKEWRPTIFATAPWLKAPLQVNPKHLKDGTTLAKFVDNNMAPKPTEVSADSYLQKFCGFDKNTTTDKRTIGETCIVILRGTRYAKVHADLERRLVVAYPRVRMAALEAKKKRLSHEESTELVPADNFALKLHALRNGTHYITMVNPATWDYMNTFVGHAVGSPLYGFSGDGDVPIRLIKAPAPKAPKPAKKDKKSSKSTSQKKKQQPKQEQEQEREQSSSSSSSTPELDPALVEAARRYKEQTRREEMDRQAKQHMFQEEEGNGDAADEEDGQESSQEEEDNDDDASDGDEEDDDDEDMIEL
mmetsp:Transcript_21954/g.36766  ORF Transcript_21954/g.36766 Transcript_21954/m.36766 type:complete len:433 (-) Transcript_21954:239-1537(-)